ncbi:MAG: hypothetical protein ACD_39C01878G0001, partial [uncultured bacterium]
MPVDNRSVFPFLFWFLVVLCFFIFPFFLMNLTMNRYLAMVRQQEETAEMLEAGKYLTRLSANSDGARYFHLVLQKTLSDIDPDRPMHDLGARIARLRSMFPGAFEFIVWNQDGEVDESLTDDTNYLYLKKKLNIFLKDLYDSARASAPYAPDLTKEQLQQIRPFRQFLGPFVPSSVIARSFLPSVSTGCFQMHGKGKQAYGWYTAQAAASVFVYVSYDRMNEMLEPKTLCQRYSRLGKGKRFFLVNEQSLEIYPHLDEKLSSQLIINLKKTTSITPPELLKSGNNLYVYQKLSGEWWAAAMIDSSSFSAAEEQGRKLAVRLLFAILLSIFVLYCFFLVHDNPFTSIRWKLMLIFAYTVALPVMIFTTIGFEYSAQKQRNIEHEHGVALIQLLTRMDKQFQFFLHELASDINNHTDRSFWPAVTSVGLEGFAGQLKTQFAPMATVIVDQSGKSVLPRGYAENIPVLLVLRTVGTDLLKFLNLAAGSPERSVNVLTENAISAYSRSNRAISLFHFPGRATYYYQHLLKNPQTEHYEYCIQILWDLRDLQIAFFERFAARLKRDRQIVPVLFFPDNCHTVTADSVGHQLADFFDRVSKRGLQLETFVSKEKKHYIAAGVRGQNLSQALSAVLLESDAVQAEIGRYKANLLKMLVVTFLFSWALYVLLNLQILTPVNQLVTGVEKVRDGDYAHRVVIAADNELGKLAKSFNHTLENLRELLIAQQVQSALLPESLPEFAGFATFARTKPMQKLGGDFYDLFVDHQGNLLCVIGDVAGHGTQAALMMAMAKSVMIMSQLEKLTAGETMARLNSTFFSLRKSAIKTMMTCQIFTLSLEAGGSGMINAGHCPPLIVSADGREVATLDSQSFPLGFGRNREFPATPLALAAGSTLILYTDGVLESINSEGLMLGA